MHHPSIVSVSEVFEENGTAYFVMDYIDGPSLHEIVKKEGALDEKRAVRYVRQAAEALQYVHNRNRLHLDIKPHNIMVNSNDQAILIDFGASKQYDEMNGENTSTLIGQTPGYAPLEQIGNDVVKFFPATDIYSLGATLYKLLSGETPLSASLLASGEELEPLPAHITERTRTAVAAAMTVNKNKRPQTIADFLILLGEEEVAQESPVNVQLGTSENKSGESEETVVIGGAASQHPEPSVEFVSSSAPKDEGVKVGRLIAIICGVCVLVGVLSVLIGYVAGRDNVYEDAYRKATEQTQTTGSSTPVKQTPSQSVNTPSSTSTTSAAPVEENKTEEVVDQNAETLKKALRNNDYQTVQRLANSGYAASYGPLAKYYLQNNEYELAETYAKKAKAAGYSDGNKVITALTQLGYYD